jgi:hypothetical protein
MSTRDHKVLVSLNDDELAVLDEHRGGTPARRLPAAAAPRAAEDNRRGYTGRGDGVADRARAGGPSAGCDRPARELREGDPDLTYEWILHGSD